jgi:hypothetical protein
VCLYVWATVRFGFRVEGFGLRVQGLGYQLLFGLQCRQI